MELTAEEWAEIAEEEAATYARLHQPPPVPADPQPIIPAQPLPVAAAAVLPAQPPQPPPPAVRPVHYSSFVKVIADAVGYPPETVLLALKAAGVIVAVGTGGYLLYCTIASTAVPIVIVPDDVAAIVDFSRSFWQFIRTCFTAVNIVA